MTAKTVSQLAREFCVSTPKMLKELELVPGLKFNAERKDGVKVRLIFPVDLVKIYKHLGNPVEY